MKKLLKKIVYDIGIFLGKVSGKMISCGGSYKNIYSVINSKASRLPKTIKNDTGKYIQEVIKIADDTLASVEVDSKFYNDYYYLQKKNIIINNDFIPAIVGLLTGISSSVLFNHIYGNVLKVQTTNWLKYVIIAIFSIIVVGIIVYVPSQLRGVDNCIIKPYILDKMKKRIDDHSKISQTSISLDHRDTE